MILLKATTAPQKVYFPVTGEALPEPLDLVLVHTVTEEVHEFTFENPMSPVVPLINENNLVFETAIITERDDDDETPDPVVELVDGYYIVTVELEGNESKGEYEYRLLSDGEVISNGLLWLSEPGNIFKETKER